MLRGVITIVACFLTCYQCDNRNNDRYKELVSRGGLMKSIETQMPKESKFFDMSDFNDCEYQNSAKSQWLRNDKEFPDICQVCRHSFYVPCMHLQVIAAKLLSFHLFTRKTCQNDNLQIIVSRQKSFLNWNVQTFAKRFWWNFVRCVPVSRSEWRDRSVGFLQLLA